MRLLARLEHKLSRFAIPNFTLGLIFAQVLVYVFALSKPEILERFVFVPRLVLEGEVWRLLTFLCIPPLGNPILNFFFWYMLYLMGTALETHWGTLKYNVYLLLGWLTTVATAFLYPDVPLATNGFLQGSVFLAFAYLYPNFELALFFLLPIKIKWLALLQWIGYVYTMIVDDGAGRWMIMASVFNYLVFFHRDVLSRASDSRRRMSRQAVHLSRVVPDGPRHRCLVCGITSETHPKMDFRYCSKCAGSCGYCTDHIRNHEHVVEEVAKSDE